MPARKAPTSQIEAERRRREERLAKALRDNLRRRKDQVRSRGQPKEPGGKPDA